MNTFSELMEGEYVYADKTRLVYDLVSNGKAYFLSRPRRFGKSLLLSTFKSLFSGPPDPEGPPQGLFAELWIGRESYYDFAQKHPVLAFSMASDLASPDDLWESILKKLERINDSEGLGLDISLPGTDLALTIQGLHEKYGKKVVVLVDEYDAPVSDNLDNMDLALRNRDILKGFYSGFKDTDEDLRFVFVTGVTRHVFMGLSAGLNHLTDLTLDANFSGICGFTLQELEGCFSDRLPDLLRTMKEVGNMPKEATIGDMWKEIALWYGGYSWDGRTRLYNPYSLVSLFRGDSFEPFWMNLDPSAKMLSDILAHDPLAVTVDRFKDLSTGQIGLAEVGSLAPVPALFQTGFLTVDKIGYSPDHSKLFSLRLPNKDVIPKFYSKFSNSLNKYFKTSPNSKRIYFHGIIEDNDAVDLSSLINSIFGSLPAIRHRAEESFYHSVLHGYLFDMPGTVISLSEQPGAMGTPDIVVVFDDGLHAVIALKYEKGVDDDPDGEGNIVARRKKRPGPTKTEVKTIQTRLAQDALAAIDGKEYPRPHGSRARRVIKIGLGIYGRGQSLALMES
ncbi:MAG: AAA family ATPase [Deltaproteobacteria bacterium]|nr:AAA family ATPase [Deltaproteobacteria bacterium]